MHAEYIHANCDCQYAVRFDSRSTVAGYDPERYKAMYDAQEGTPQEKINALRRQIYHEKKWTATENGDILEARSGDRAVTARGMANGPRRSAKTIITKTEEQELRAEAAKIGIPQEVLSFNKAVSQDFLTLET